MTVGLWVILAIGAYFALSFAVSLMLGAILGRISEKAPQLLESQAWASAPLKRAVASTEEVAVEEEAVELAEPIARAPRRKTGSTRTVLVA
jgi:hypothetical protein